MINDTNNKPVFNFDFGASESGGKPDKSKYYAIADYIGDLVSIDKDNSTIATNTKLMITKYRKLYYNSRGWNDLLIPETADITVFDSTAVTQKIQHSHEVILSDGDLYDAAHIFAILDASNHNGPFSPIPAGLIAAHIPKVLRALIPVVHDRLMAAGWLGDLSEITGQFYQRNAKDTAAKQVIINQFGAYYKNLANVDGMIMTQHYDLSSDNAQKLSDIFTAYFGLTTQTGLRAKLKSSRYLDFATSIGLKSWNGSEFENSAAWLKYQLPNLRTCTAFYLVKDRGLSLDILSGQGNSVKEDLESALSSLALSELERELAKHFLAKLDSQNDPIKSDLITLIICFLTWKGFYDERLSIKALLSSYIDGLAQAIKKTQAQ